MCIEVSEDLVIAAENGNSSAIGMLEKLAIAIKFEKHLVFAQLDLLDRIDSLAGLDAMSKSQFSKIKSSYSEVGQIYRCLNSKAVIYNTGKNCRTKNNILIYASDSEKLEVYEETHLLTENLIDGEFFEYLVKQYIKSKGVTWPICYMPQMGGGNTIAKVYKMEIDRGQHFCLSILDSDKKWPTASKGDTYDKLQKEDKNCYKGDSNGSDGHYAYNCHYYVMEELRELENLIPLEVFRSMPNVRNSPLLGMNIDYSYHDMKEGLLARTIAEGDYQNYLHNVYHAYPGIIDNVDFCATFRKQFFPKNKDAYEKYCGRWKFSEGLGSKIMDHVLSDATDELSKTDYLKLSKPQQNEWSNIGRTVFEWCCSFQSGAT